MVCLGLEVKDTDLDPNLLATGGGGGGEAVISVHLSFRTCKNMLEDIWLELCSCMT